MALGDHAGPPAWHGWDDLLVHNKQHKQHRGMRLHGRGRCLFCCQQICIPTSRPKAYPARCVSPWAFVVFSDERGRWEMALLLLSCSSRSEYWTELRFGQGPLVGNMRPTHLSQLARHDSTDAQGVRGCRLQQPKREVVFRLSAYRVLRSSPKRYTHTSLAPRPAISGGVV